MIRFTSQLRTGCFALAALCAVPALAQDIATAPQPLTQALTALSSANGFEVRGLDKVGDETVTLPKAATPIQSLKRILDGYAYTLELAPAEGAGNGAGKLTRVSIVGHVGDAPAAGSDRPGAPATATATALQFDTSAEPVTTADSGAAGTSVHPVAHLLRSLALTTRPVLSPSSTLLDSAQPAGAPATAPTGSASAAAAPPASGNTAANAPDMAALTRTASANLSALVQSLKAACPAGGHC